MKKIFYLLFILANAHWCMGQTNTFRGISAGGSTTSGLYNSFFGYYSGMFNTVGSSNDFFGANTGQANSGGSNNLFIGFQSASLQTNSQYNTYIGSRASIQTNQLGANNTAAGHGAGTSNYNGNAGNVFFGQNAGAGRSLLNRLSIRTQLSANDLLYGEFDNKRLAINNNVANATLDVNGSIQISTATIPMGLIPEVGGTTPVLNLSLNFRESNKAISYMGAAFRVDSRPGYPTFQWITRAASSTIDETAMSLTNNGNLYVQGNVLVGSKLTTNAIASPDATTGRIKIGYDPAITATTQVPGITVEKFVCTDCADNVNDANMKRVLINTAVGVNGASLSVNGAMHIRSKDAATGAPFKVGTSGYLKDFLLWVEKGLISNDFIIAPPSNWSDYVFKEDYHLASLDNVEQYIEQNGHLPNMPSEEEIKENGYTFHDMNMRLLEKIEELTLYKIQQEKQLGQLEALAVAKGLKQ